MRPHIGQGYTRQGRRVDHIPVLDKTEMKAAGIPLVCMHTVYGGLRRYRHTK